MSSTVVSNELIAYQKGTPLFNAMVELIDGFQNTPNFTTKQIKYSPMSDLIMKYTGLNIDFDDYLKQDHDAFVTIPDINKNSVLWNDIAPVVFKNMDFKALSSKYDELNGSVNLKTSKVSGIFSKFKTTIGLGNGFWKKNELIVVSPQEVAAVILHELGHVFTSYLFLLEAVKTNIVLSSLNRENFFNCPKDKKIKLLKELEETMDIRVDDKETLAVCEDKIVYSVLISNAITTRRSELKTPTYDERTMEFVCDQFAAMHGAGAYLVTGLQKILVKYGVLYDRKMSVVKITLLYCATLYSYSFGTLVIIRRVGIARYLAGMLSFILSIAGFITIAILPLITPNLYDPPLIRFNKIKEQYVNALRDRSLSNSDKQRLIKDIETIDDCIKFTGQYPDIFKFIYNVLMPWGRRAQTVAKLQNDYESLAYNPFYVASAKLSL